MSKYINKRIYTDVESYLVTEIDEVKGTAMAIEVEKRIKPKMIPGGFAAHCPDLHREFAEAEPVICKGAKPFQIKRNKDGIWGFKHAVVALALPVKGIVQPVKLSDSLRLLDPPLSQKAYHLSPGHLTHGALFHHAPLPLLSKHAGNEPDRGGQKFRLPSVDT